jgi:hypothetical protein
LKKFESLSGALFRHGGGGGDLGRELFGIVIEAMCIIVQYQMDNDRRELFAI